MQKWLDLASLEATGIEVILFRNRLKQLFHRARYIYFQSFTNCLEFSRRRNYNHYQYRCGNEDISAGSYRKSYSGQEVVDIMAVKKGAKKKKPAVARPKPRKAAKKKAAQKTVKKQAAKTIKKKAKKAVAKKAAKKTVKRAVVKTVARKAAKAVTAAKKTTTTSPKAEAAHLSPATKKRYALLKAILLKKRNEVVEGIEARIGRKLTTESGQKVDSAMDSADMSSHDVEQGMDYSLLEMKYEQYKDIADAFRKLENVTFGLCEECGEEIDIKRLEVNPLARYCIACKTRKEDIERIQKEETRFKE